MPRKYKDRFDCDIWLDRLLPSYRLSQPSVKCFHSFERVSCDNCRLSIRSMDDKVECTHCGRPKPFGALFANGLCAACRDYLESKEVDKL